MQHQRPTAEQVEMMVRLYHQGLSQMQIVERVGFTRRTIARQLRVRGLTEIKRRQAIRYARHRNGGVDPTPALDAAPPRAVPRRPLTAMQAKLARKAHERGRTLEEIADGFETTLAEVRRAVA